VRRAVEGARPPAAIRRRPIHHQRKTRMIKKIITALAALLAATAFAAVDANKATQAELESIKGIGPSISAKIVDERKKGSYKDWNDLVTRVNGIGDKNAATFSTGGLTVDGKAYAGAPAAKMAPAASSPSTTAKVTGTVKSGADSVASGAKSVGHTVAESTREQKKAFDENLAESKKTYGTKKSKEAAASAPATK
jgi:competence protein ComEA